MLCTKRNESLYNGSGCLQWDKVSRLSEEDAQTANFIGNIIGSYAASSAASKFSLNKVKR